MSSRPDLKLDWCAAKAARYAVMHWHYSGTYPTGKPNHIGVWENGLFVGVIMFGSGASAGLGKPYGLRTFSVAELVRVALRNHANAISRMLAIAVRMIRRHNPGLRLIVSFADPYHGHHGGIYQAAGWVYSGSSQPSQMWRLADGSMAHPRRFTGTGWNAKQPIPAGAVLVKVPGKHRYLMPLDDAMRRQIEPLRQPYPKRAGSADSGTSAIQAGGGGANPTSALSTVTEDAA